MESIGGEGGVSMGAGRTQGLKGMKFCVLHDEVCGGCKGEGERASAPEVVGMAARQELKEARSHSGLI